MKKHPTEYKPTDSELAILQVLWEQETATVREVNEVLAQKREVGYTTTLKLMQIMTEKGLVACDKSNRTHRYRALITEKDTQNKLLNRLMDSAFRGSAMQLVVSALGSEKTSDADLAAIKALIEKMEGGAS